MNSKNIGVFDSGVGGLTVVKHLINTLPNENIIYFGDTARVPYGSRSNKTILKYGLQDINFLKSKNIKIVIAACGTISSIFFKNNINHSYFNEFFYTGVIEPTARLAVNTTKNKNIGIIATKATIQSKAYELYIKKLDNKINTISTACPLFVPIIEEGLFYHNVNIVYDIVDLYLKDLKSTKIDTLILGCTHYPLLSEIIYNYFNNNINLIDPGIAVSNFIKSYLTEKDLLCQNGSIRKFYVSDNLDKFGDIANKFLGKDITQNIHTINLDIIDK